MTKQSPKRHECGSLWKSVKTIVRITCWAWNSVQPKPIEIYICKQEWWGGRMHRNEAWSWNAVIKAVGGEKAINWLPSSHWKRSGNVLVPNVTPSVPVFLLSLVSHLSNSNFSYLCYRSMEELFDFALSYPDKLLLIQPLCIILLITNTTASELKKKEKKKNPTQEISQHHHGLRELAAVTGGNL